MKRQCIECDKPATNGVYCATHYKTAHAKFASGGDAAPKGTFKKVVKARAKVVHAAHA